MPPATTKRDWYERNAHAYERLEPALPGESAFYVALTRRSGGPVLELGCGTGRIALAVARSGVAAVGLDRSSAMLAVAREATAPADHVAWLRSDMRRFAFRCRFGMICIPFRGFLHLLTDADRAHTLACCREHLAPDGILALNVFNPAPALDALRARWTGAGQSASAAALSATTVTTDDLPGVMAAGPYAGRPMRPVSAEEMYRLFEAAGFAVESLRGGFGGEPFTAESPEQVWVARLAAQASDSG